MAALAIVVTAAVTGTPTPAAADSARDQQWHLAYLHVADAQKISQGEGVVVGVADSGVDASAPELTSAVLPGNEFGRSGEGRVDTDGHGTAMAGLIAGRGKGHDDGVLGIAPKASILPLRVSRAPEFGGDPANLAAGIEWATAQGAKVICIALDVSQNPAMRAALEKALAADVVIVAAAGNLPGTKTVAYPARMPGVLAVGGIDQQGHHAEISTTGPEVAITAPAVDIVSLDFGARYRKGTGTSDAAAIVAGAAALVRAKYPQLSAQEVIRRLTYTAQDAGAPGRDPEYGYGILDLVKALTAEVPPASPSAAPEASPSAGPGKDAGGDRSVAVIAAIGAAVVVVVFISVLQSIIRGRRQRR
ncbi:type VII secretion-associated serine protease mycosin [Dactylosporangium sp. NPDC000555]|uniref:type VII secretion-associated serine protease mycosin n=1 Tax=Dactylosporangium sp. NPDC000555 TaxID=3154260 RepID=UPI00331FEDF4